MGTPLELLIYIAVFAFSLGLVYCLLGETDHDKRKLRAAHERHRIRNNPPRPRHRHAH